MPRQSKRERARKRERAHRERLANTMGFLLRAEMHTEFCEYMALTYGAELESGIAAVWRKRGAHEAWPRRVHAALLAVQEVLGDDGDHALAWRVTRFLL